MQPPFANFAAHKMNLKTRATVRNNRQEHMKIQVMVANNQHEGTPKLGRKHKSNSNMIEAMQA